MRRLARVLGAALVTVGVLTLVWVVVVWQWQDPFTALYTHFEQARLSHTYERRAAEFHPHLPRADLASSERRIAADARIYGRTLNTGDPVGRLRIGRIGLNMVVVQGTDHSTLKRGPGHYIGSALPGRVISSTSRAIARRISRRSQISTTFASATTSPSKCPTESSPTV